MAAMRIVAPLAPLPALSFLPRARVGQGHEEGATVPVAAHLAVTPVQSSAAYLAQTIAQELIGGPLTPAYHWVAAYVPKPNAAFEGLNFREIA